MRTHHDGDPRRGSDDTIDSCDEIRPTRLHYQLRCRLARDHQGDHRWTPELVPHDLGVRETA